MDVLWIYLICLIFTGYGFLLFLWWGLKVGKTTTAYKYVMVLLLAEFIEKAIFAFLRGWNLCDVTIKIYMLIFSDWALILFALPTTIAFGAMVISMTIRVYRSYFSKDKNENESNNV